MNIWHDINPKQITTEEFIAVIEIPKNSKVDRKSTRLNSSHPK